MSSCSIIRVPPLMGQTLSIPCQARRLDLCQGQGLDLVRGGGGDHIVGVGDDEQILGPSRRLAQRRGGGVEGVRLGW